MSYPNSITKISLLIQNQIKVRNLRFFSVLAIQLFIVIGFAAMFTSNPVYLSLIGLAVVVASFGTPKNVAFETIPVDQIRAAITNSMVAIYNEKPQVKSFLRSFFPEIVSPTKDISIGVRRGTEKIAVDVIRGGQSNLNQVTKSTQKTIIPAFYNEEAFLNELEIYDTAWTTLNPSMLRSLAEAQVDVLGRMIDKIDRAYEKQCADVLQTGIITLNAGDSIDYRRKAGSMVNNSSYYFSNSSNDPFAIFQLGAKFLREEGKIQISPNGAYVCILGNAAMASLKANTKFQEQMRLNFKQLLTKDFLPAEMTDAGATYHGRITSGSYEFDLWTYPEIYEDANGNKVNYIDTKKMIMTTYKAEFNFIYGAVPQIPGVVVPSTIRQGFYQLEYIDPRQMCHGMKVMSAGVAVPTAVDRIFTAQVLS